MIIASENPFIRLNPISFNKRLKREPLTTSFAIPCTIIAED